MIHKLKILPVYFKAVGRGEKRFEIRKNSDRAFQKGDTVILREFEHINGYTGAEITVEITYVTNYNQPDNQVVFGFFVIDAIKKEIDLDISGQLDKLLAKQNGTEISVGDKVVSENHVGEYDVLAVFFDKRCGEYRAVCENDTSIYTGIRVSILSIVPTPEQIRIKNGQALKELFESLQHKDTDTENVWANFADLVTLKSEHEE